MDRNHIAQIVGILPDYLTLPILYIIRYNFYKSILEFDKKICTYIITTLLLTMFSLLDLSITSKTLVIILSDILLFLTVNFLYQGNIIIKFYAIIIENTILLLVNLIILPFDFLISPIINNIDMSFELHMFVNFMRIGIYDILSYIILYIVLIKISDYLNFKDKYINLYQGLYLLIPSISSYGLASIIYFIQEIKINNEVYYLPNISSKTYVVFLSIVSFLLLISIPMVAYSFKNIIELDEQKRKTMIIEHQFSLQINHMKSVDGIYLGIRKVIHDMNNHISCLRNLADNNNLKEVKKYLHNISETVSCLNFKIKTGNPISDAIVNEKFNISLAEGIKFKSDFMIPPEISVESIDLCVILSNALDNSIEACMKISDPAIEKKISLKSYIRGYYLIIEITNSSIDRLRYIGNKIISNKPDKVNHGIGLLNIEDVVKKYNGVIDIMEGKNCFTICIMLKIN
ncbi:hypothetical protein CLOBY_00700 [Clostridium saccharobutylicum]|uniref:sensor histidine kinase n=1 Tax=Clostridium saccharobutylicum TaxID=169679 RepID=UPI00098394D5|nr:sensor histidine kinase [Clostridium saccharobutylicum]AQS08021.1 hypothetical protein CLOBY_00700 [Clostridium saccharobutylicum]MBC2436997.1 GHKL domain-containing protein [Clostridium saccharobutylicum]NSB89349.1 hypothetical protein [Clostridium saccharobutylicum]NYC29658.1 hypothetical protein [Clostridium saccharobutylicum]OOM17352.1 hypothetical protein CLSAB_17770 [Clostridium saccharobutylicum]